MNTVASLWSENMLECWSLDIICSSGFIVFAEKYRSTFSRQMEGIVYVTPFPIPNIVTVTYGSDKSDSFPLEKYKYLLNPTVLHLLT